MFTTANIWLSTNSQDTTRKLAKHISIQNDFEQMKLPTCILDYLRDKPNSFCLFLTSNYFKLTHIRFFLLPSYLCIFFYLFKSCVMRIIDIFEETFLALILLTSQTFRFTTIFLEMFSASREWYVHQCL